MTLTPRVLHLCGSPMINNAELADGFLSRLRGMLGRTDLPSDFCLILTPCSSIHMAFMKMPLDIAYLDKEGAVIALQWDLKPWKIGEIHKGTYSILEAPLGGVIRQMKIGDRVSW